MGPRQVFISSIHAPHIMHKDNLTHELFVLKWRCSLQGMCFDLRLGLPLNQSSAAPHAAGASAKYTEKWSMMHRSGRAEVEAQLPGQWK